MPKKHASCTALHAYNMYMARDSLAIHEALEAESPVGFARAGGEEDQKLDSQKQEKSDSQKQEQEKF